MEDGYSNLVKDVMEDCAKDKNCFNEDGCNKVGCSHKYCDKLVWVVNRAKHYAKKLGLDWKEILDSWEEDRSYWYMNYYQDSHQPKIESDNVRVFDTVDELRNSVGDKFRCPYCTEVTSNPIECESCGWKVYGLLGHLGKGAFIFCKENLKSYNIFMPTAWESEEVGTGD